MLKFYLFSLLLLVLTINLLAQSPCQLDISFNSNGKLISDANRIGERLVALPDGSSLIAYNSFGNGHVYIRHLLIDGSIDNTYGTAGKTTIQAASLYTSVYAMLLVNNELYVCGNTGSGSNMYAFIAKLKSDGLLDATFGTAGVIQFAAYLTFNDMLLEPGTNKIVVAGMKSPTKAMIARLQTNGVIDASFGIL